jgi:threonyl-tRNA synthetase
MNCPGHVQIFNQFGQKSYRDLPLRMAEFGACHRYEPSGALHGLMRVRASRRTMRTSSAAKTRSRTRRRFITLASSIHEDFGLERITSRWPRARRCAPARTSSGTRPKAS